MTSSVSQEVPDFQQVTPLPYVYTDFIEPKEPNQVYAEAQHFEDFGYSLVQCGDEQSTVCPDAEEEW